MSGTYQAIFGNEVASSRVVPVSVALKPTYQHGKMPNWHHVGLVRMKFAIANPAAWNRWISPSRFTPVQLGSNFKLVWTINNADPYVAKPFTVTVMKGLPNTPVTAAYQAGPGGVPKYMR